MASRPKGYGLTAELAAKTASKYCQEDEIEIVAWIRAVLQCSGPDNAGMEGFHQWLKNGEILCALMNTIEPNCIKKINKTESIRMVVSN